MVVFPVIPALAPSSNVQKPEKMPLYHLLCGICPWSSVTHMPALKLRMYVSTTKHVNEDNL